MPPTTPPSPKPLMEITLVPRDQFIYRGAGTRTGYPHPHNINNNQYLATTAATCHAAGTAKEVEGEEEEGVVQDKEVQDGTAAPRPLDGLQGLGPGPGPAVSQGQKQNPTPSSCHQQSATHNNHPTWDYPHWQHPTTRAHRSRLHEGLNSAIQQRVPPSQPLPHIGNKIPNNPNHSPPMPTIQRWQPDRGRCLGRRPFLPKHKKGGHIPAYGQQMGNPSPPQHPHQLFQSWSPPKP
jgi:hypothetical protein